MTTIYKKDTKGNVRYLTISTEGNKIIQTSGMLGTENPTYNESVCEPKNVGRSNATTAEEQAIKELEAKVVDKLKTGYFVTIEEAEKLGGKDFLLPMLAQDAKKMLNKIIFPCWVQPKLDGMRGLNNGEFSSRTGKAITTLDHIKIPSRGDLILDGELYAHGLSFQENMKIIKKYRKGETEKVKYHVYDCVLPDVPFAERSLLLLRLFGDNEEVELVESFYISNMEELLAAHKEFIAQGYEGTMIRHTEIGYQVNKRSSQLLKYKDFLDEAYKVIDVTPSEKRPEHGVLVCQNDKGDTFQTGMKFSHKEREEILIHKEKYIGQMAEVRFFEFTDGGIPRFPVAVGFRLDK